MSRDTYEHRHTFEESGPMPDMKDLEVVTPSGQTFVCTTLNFDKDKIRPVVMKGLDNVSNHILSDKSIEINDANPDKHMSQWDDK